VTSEDRRTDEVSDAALARAARVGDREAFEAIVHRHGPSLYRYARRMLADDGDVQEVVQDAFVGAWRDFDSYRDQSSLRTWLFGIAAHKAIDRARKARAKPIDDRVLQTKPAGPEVTHTSTCPRRSSSKPWSGRWRSCSTGNERAGCCGKWRR